MKILFDLLAFCCVASLATRNLAAQAPKTDSRIKIAGTGVELANLEPWASQCREPKNGMTVTFKVTSPAAIDVRLQITGAGISTVTKDFPSQASGAQILDYMCLPNAKYTVLIRPAGSNQAWPEK